MTNVAGKSVVATTTGIVVGVSEATAGGGAAGEFDAGEQAERISIRIRIVGI